MIKIDAAAPSARGGEDQKSCESIEPNIPTNSPNGNKSVDRLLLWREANRLVKMGFTPFLVDKDKRPLYPWKDLTLENALTKLKEVLPTTREANLAVRIPEGVIAVDIDMKNGIDGLENLESVAPPLWDLDWETCPLQKTPSGGFHLLFKLPASLKGNGNKTGRLPNVPSSSRYRPRKCRIQKP